MAMAKVGIGVIGCGGISSEHLKSYALFPEICEIVAVCDANLERAEARKREFNVPSAYQNHTELLKDNRVDAVSICTPHNLHAPIAVEAAEAGKHVLVEKPMAMSFNEAGEMIKASKRSGVKLSVIFQNRFSPYNKFMKEKAIPHLGRPIFGYVTTFHYRDSAYYASGPWRGKWAGEGGGVFINQAIHAWDIMQWFMGGGVVKAEGYWTNILHPSIEVEDIGYGSVGLGNGSKLKVLTTTCCSGPNMGMIRFKNGTYRGVGEELTNGDFELTDESLEEDLKTQLSQRRSEKEKYGNHAKQILDFVQAIREDREAWVTGESAAESLKIVDGLHERGREFEGTFKKWILQNYALPSQVEDLKNKDLEHVGGLGQLIKDLIKIVMSERPLPIPFV